MAYAYCYQSGHIEVAPRLADVPSGTIIFAKGARRIIDEAVSARARHARDCDALLVPGVPEAENSEKAFKALLAWQAWAFPGHAWRQVS